MKANRPHSRRGSPRYRWMQGGVGCVVMAMLASCVGPPQPVAAPPVRQAPPPVAYAPPPPRATRPEWRDAPITPGDWHWAREGSDSVARFGPPGASLFVLRCSMASRAVVIDLPANGATQNTSLVITTSSQSRSLLAQPRGGWLELALGGRDTLLDAMAFSRGRFMVETSGAGPLYLPSWPEVSRVIEDCRAG